MAENKCSWSKTTSESKLEAASEKDFRSGKNIPKIFEILLKSYEKYILSCFVTRLSLETGYQYGQNYMEGRQLLL